MKRMGPPVGWVHTLEVAGRAVLTFVATPREAQSLPRETWIREDLREARSSGVPVWDGDAKLSVRRATTEETVIYNEIAASGSNGADGLTLVYLIELD
jgi:hypothetical protein